MVAFGTLPGSAALMAVGLVGWWVGYHEMHATWEGGRSGGSRQMCGRWVDAMRPLCHSPFVLPGRLRTITQRRVGRGIGLPNNSMKVRGV